MTARTKRWMLWGLSAVVLMRIGIFALHGTLGLASDTKDLVRENAALRACLMSGNFPPCEGGGTFPPFQHLLAFLGADVRMLALVSFLAFLGTLTLGWRALPGLRPVWIVVMGTGPLLFYAQSSFGEMLGAFLILSALVAITSGVHAAWLLPLFALAGMTKDVAPPFLGLLALIALGRGNRRLAWAAAGAVLAVACNAGLNFFRFGVPYNLAQLGPRVPKVSPGDHAAFFVGEWLSPNAGLVFFWTSFVVTLVGALTLAWRFRARRERWLPAVGVALTLGALSLGFAKWWAPFGWVAWGPRLLLPWIPASLFLLLRAYPEIGVRLRARAHEVPRYRVVLAIALITLVGLTQFGSLFAYGALAEIFTPGTGCPVVPADAGADPQAYFSCMRTWTWEPRIRLTSLFRGLMFPPSTLFTLAYAIALAGWCFEGVRVLSPSTQRD